MSHRYTVVIQWSDEDSAYVVSLPEFGQLAHTHGRTYEEALENAQEVLDVLVEGYPESGRTLPEPQFFDRESLKVA